jgi:hypothetical protein
MLTTEIPNARTARRSDPHPLPAYRLNLMRVGYLVMFVGLVVFRWPYLFQASSLPAMESAVVALMVAMSLLAFLGLRHPTAMLPVLLFEVLWKLIWLGAVGLPHLLADDMDAPMQKLFSSILWVVLILAVTPWDYAWKRYVKTPGDRWRGRA